ncbi:helix-turn-helix domain-containing protein [Streptomyces gobiensis]|uniref:helix-turn-helix domain-containing protein n=1 Tax=Streptomyces gobiensis TaxID=2875706 RepID=UPI001E629433|nr:helix-turn-helix transcriptional regulator [Streptomyces gobiensis]UGY92925.1 helix-turn-helix domain-containing protein [Streptomyces gobiensis]
MVWRKGVEGDHAAELAGARLARQATASLAGLLAERGMSRKDLADCMGVSPGRVSQILSGDENLTMRSLAAVAEALSAQVEITFFDPPIPSQPEPRESTAPETGPLTGSFVSSSQFTN